MAGFSRYTPAIAQFQQATGGDVYCFVIDGKLGSGGQPMIAGIPPRDEYRRRCQELIAMLRRSAELLEQDLARQVPIGPGAGSVG